MQNLKLMKAEAVQDVESQCSYKIQLVIAGEVRSPLQNQLSRQVVYKIVDQAHNIGEEPRTVFDIVFEKIKSMMM